MNNPFFTDFNLPYDAVPFSKFKTEDFIPAAEKSIGLDSDIGNVKINLNKFSELVEKIIKKNNSRAYPDINDTPN